MKKVLFATTALVATAGMAAAEVSFGGYGRFGLFYQENNAAGADETRIEQRFRFTITGQTTSDNGLEFEGRIRFQTDENAAGASNVANRSAAGFAVSTGGFRLDVGHVSDVLDSGDVVDYYGYGVGLTSFLEQSSNFALPASGFGTNSDDTTIAPTVKLRYNVGDFTVSVSFTDDAIINGSSTNVGTSTVVNTATSGEEFQIGVGYSFGNYSVGAVYGNADTSVTTVTTVGAGAPTTTNTTNDNDFWAINFAGDVGPLGFSVLIGDSDGQADVSYGFSVKYDISAVTDVRFAFSDSGEPGNSDGYGIGFRHSLGGGVSLQGGIGDNSGTTIADLGVIFNF